MKKTRLIVFIFLLLTALSSSLCYSQQVNQYDENQNWEIGDFELLSAIDDWAAGLLGDFDLLDLIDFWAAGCYQWDTAAGGYITDCEPNTSTSIGPSGGIVKPGKGVMLSPGTQLIVPSNALTEEVPISLTLTEATTIPLAEKADESLIKAIMSFAMDRNKEEYSHPIFTPAAILTHGSNIGIEFQLSPEGTEFSQPAILKVPLVDISEQTDSLNVVLLESAGGIIEVVRDIQITADTLNMPLNHFSNVSIWNIIGNAVKFVSISLLTFPKDDIEHAMNLVGPFVDAINMNILEAQCNQSNIAPIVNTELPSYPQLLNNLARSVGEIAGDTLGMEAELKIWLNNIRLQGLPKVSIAEIHKKSLELTGGNVFQALVVAHEVLRADRFDKSFKDLIHDVRGDGKDEVGARYHLFGTAIYGFWYEHINNQSGIEGKLSVPNDLASFFEETFVSGDILTDPGEYVVDMAGAELGRELYAATIAAQEGKEEGPCLSNPLPNSVTYEGTGTSTHLIATTSFGSASCPSTATWEITLYHEGIFAGELRGTYTNVNPKDATSYGGVRCVDSSDQHNIYFGGTHSNGNFEIKSSSGGSLYYDYTNSLFLSGDTPFTGTYNNNSISAHYTYIDDFWSYALYTFEHEFNLPQKP